ncbi:hypothetical protein M972_11921 [Acetivibrio thermocellus AD2]|uniref:Uncharacterized protein n=1 Tax=Acetivibrio thermocellus AD2 TaxID=1138384 RepID=A0AB36TH25_ACETH|nr:hypothetical protein Clo1313_0878 [Acetivibrio thermocellus DSM 1313]ALX07884.1 hypothetical protein AD2_00889 [Acetivibrio thermocellus AD2]ANV75630.1 hypothetical protein LQRI_0889 [Acetivibrio thermocellus DSM 2360]EIC03251.1 hypothetical protein YSBL_0208 [Acetivibrio thermocellus YS]SOD26372.1 hypothetical protein SAMN04515622_2667 [Acetivibrio thermocellus]
MVIVLAVVLIMGLIGSLLFLKSRPKNIIEDKLGIKLPVESKVVNFSNNMLGEYFMRKY